MKKMTAFGITLMMIIQLLSMSNMDIISSTIELPATPEGVNATSTETTLTVSWSGVDGAINYDVKVNGNINTTSQTSYTYTGLEADSTYEYSVRAKNDFGSSAYSSTQVLKTLAAVKIISVPNGLSSNATESSITISWSPISTATGYEISTGNSIVSTTATSYTFSGLAPDTSFNYSVRTLEGNEKSEFSTAISVRTLIPELVVEEPDPVEQPEPVEPDPIELDPIEEEPIEELDAEETQELEEEPIEEVQVEETVIETELVDEIQMLASVEILNDDIDFIHQVNTDFLLFWQNGVDGIASAFDVNVYDEDAYLVYSKKVKADDSYEYVIPATEFSVSGDYIVEILAYIGNDEIGGRTQKAVHVLNLSEAKAITGIYNKYTDKTYILNGEIQVVDMNQIVEFGFYWGDNILMKNKLVVDDMTVGGKYSKRVPEVEIGKNYYYMSYVRKRNGDYEYGQVLSFQNNEQTRNSLPELIKVDKGEYNFETQEQVFSIETDLGTEKLTFIDSLGSVISYQNSYKDIDDVRVWEIKRYYPVDGIYEEDIYGWSYGRFSDVNTQISLMGAKSYKALEISIKKEDYKYYIRQNSLMNIQARITANQDEMISQVVYCFNGTLNDENCILKKDVNNQSVDLEEDLFTINPKEFPRQTSGAYSILIYASTRALEGQLVLVGEVTIEIVEPIDFKGIKGNYEVFSQASEFRLTGSIISLDDAYIKEVMVLTEDMSRTIYKESALSNVAREVIDFDETIELDLSGNDYKRMRVIVILNDGTIIRKDIKINMSLISIQVPDEVSVDEDVYIRVYATNLDGVRYLYETGVKLSIDDINIASLNKHRLSTINEGQLFITATINSHNNQFVTGQRLNITKKDN